MNEIELDSVQKFNEMYGFGTLHPLVTVVRYDNEHRSLDEMTLHYGLYALFLKENKGCEIFIRTHEIRFR